MSEDQQDYTDFMADEITILREQVEKLTAERDEWKNDAINGGNAGYLRDRVAALAEQNEKMREALKHHAGNYKLTKAEGRAIDEILELPDLATPVLNRIKAEGMRMAAEICDARIECQDGDALDIQDVAVAGCCDAIRAKADELSKDFSTTRKGNHREQCKDR